MFKVIYDTNSLQNEIDTHRRIHHSIGFVPTMGALHNGHLKLVKECILSNNICVVSIYINPTQFNNRNDLLKYPRTIEEDIAKLKATGANIVFIPSDSDMYPLNQFNLLDIDLGGLDTILEGKFRPGHFAGVVTIVKALFDKVKPDNAYFGQKDYQQIMVINKMLQQYKLPVAIHPVSIVREPDGLAMSSRNLLLTPEERKIAPKIYNTLIQAQKLLKKQTVNEVCRWAKKELSSGNLFKFEYFDIRDAETLNPISDLNEAKKVIILTAIWIGNIRLIDNLMIK